MKITPPNWMRFLISWRLLGWLDKHLDTCWCGMVMWKQGAGWSWWPTPTCFSPYDYCGKYDGKPLPEFGEQQ